MNRDIAIIGVSGKFPMAGNLDELFENLKTGMDCVGDIPKERIRETALPENEQYRKCGFLNDVDKFDHAFFGISLAEAKTMCPEQRLMLEVTHAAIENAGYAPATLSGSNTAVFVSVANSEYYKHATEFAATLVTGNSPEFLVAKIARQFNLKGSACAIESSCSSSLVAVHSACNELITGDADMAIVAGVHLVLFPVLKKEFNLDLDAKDGKSKAFSANANGMSYGEIAAAILLKPLDKAIADNDVIHAVIKSAAVNNNGNDSSSITAPDSKTQADVLVKAWKKAGIRADDLSYIEAHGSGTQLGDSLEIEALNLAFSAYTSAKQVCPVSTIKSNLGHGRGVSGLAGLIRTLLCLKNEVVLPTIHFDEPSHIIDFDNAAVYVNKELRNWQTDNGKKRLAGVTSIGASGTNCHVVLEEAPGRSAALHQANRFLVPVSGKTPQALHRNINALLNYINNNETNIEDISYTLTHGRDHYDYRISFVVASVNELGGELHRAMEGSAAGKHFPAPQIIFISSGSKALSDEVISGFTKQFDVFKTSWDKCSKVRSLNNPQLKDFAFQYSFYHLLNANGICTDNLLSLGIGNILRAVIDQEISLEEGLLAVQSYVPENINDTQSRVQKLLSKFASAENVIFLDLSVEGALDEWLQPYRNSNAPVYFLGHQPAQSSEDRLLEIMHVLYTRNGINNFYKHELPIGKRIELPPYQFEPKHCWLRDTPVDLNKQNAQGSKKKYRLKEEAGSVESRIGEIFAEVLDVEEISLHDDFFELGGDSLKATKVIVKINSLYHVTLNFEDLFDFPSIEQIATYLNKLLNTEKKVALIWEAVLQHEHLTPEDNFFDLGGHSLLATTMILLIRKEFNIKLNFEDIFRHQTIRALGAFIDAKLQQDQESISGIQPAPVAASYNLTYAQKRMWFLNHFDNGNTAYNNVIGVEMNGKLDYEIFNRAISLLVERHESLRTVFKMTDEGPRQFILNTKDSIFRTVITDATNAKQGEAVISEAFKEEYSHNFDLATFPLFRIKLIKTAPGKHICILNKHHIISDGWSMGIFTEEFFRNYEQLSTQDAVPVKKLDIQIKDYAEWQHTPEFEKILKQQETYWLNQFHDTVPVLSLPTDRPRPAVQSFEGDHFYFNIDAAQAAKLKKIARDHGATLYMVLLSAYNVLLGKIGNTDDITVGTPVAGRRFDGLQSLIGLFVNTIVIRSRPAAELRFRDFLKNVTQTGLQAFNNQDYPYEELVKKILTNRDTSRNPVFDTMFVLQNNKELKSGFAGIETERYFSQSNTVQFDLLVEAIEHENGIDIDFGYATALFNRDTIARMACYFKNIIAAVTEDVDRTIAEIDIMPEEEKRQVQYEFNDTNTTYPLEKTIIDLFEERAVLAPDNMALQFGERVFSYSELRTLMNKIAAYITETAAVGAGDMVGVMLEREEYLIPSIFGIMKAGAAYVPIDPHYPAERINTILNNAGLKVLFTRGRYGINIQTTACHIIDLDLVLDTIISREESLLPTRAKAGDLAYVIFTSGSTGVPKGVMIEHQAVTNRLLWMQKMYPIGESDVIMQKTPVVFDVSVWELFWWAITGASVSLLSPGAEKDPDEIIRAIKEHNVTTMHFVPSMLSLFLPALDEATDYNQLRTLRRVFASGEALKQEHVLSFGNTIHKNCGTKLINLYGPTEATVDVSHYVCIFNETGSRSIPIGKPIDNIRLYVLDATGRLAPIGIAGELYIGGIGVARGYLNNEKLTAEKFVFVPALPDERLYKTGDLARWLPDGNIEYLGRIDEQVKIRGLRIELGEIEHHLSQHPLIRESTVVAKEKQGDKFLVAYYVSDTAIDTDEIRSFLAGTLPDYMVPALYVRLNGIPLTTNGKANKKALPDPEIKATNNYVAPLGETEQKLVSIWANILHLDENTIGVHHDFFSLGGHSIRAVHLIRAIQKEFSVHIELRKIFENATVKKLARLIENSNENNDTIIPKAGERAFYPASSAQARMFYEHARNQESLTYNISNAYRIKGEADIEKLKQSIRALVNRHESLRTCFAIAENGLVQTIGDLVNVELTILNRNTFDTDNEAYWHFVQPFDLSEAPLIRFALLTGAGKDNLLFVDVHHIVCDGISLNILMNDFKRLYQNEELAHPDLTYVDYACWQNESKVTDRQKNFWMKKLSGQLPVLNLPVMQERDMVDMHPAAIELLEIDNRLYRQIRQFVKAANVTEYMFLLSVYYILLEKISGDSDIIIGTDVVGRTQPALMDIVGTFVNVLPLRVEVEPNQPYAAFLQTVKSTVLEAFEHQDFQIDQIAAMVQANGNSDRENIIDVHFSYANFIDSPEEIATLRFEPVIMERNESTQYELKLQVSEWHDKLILQFIYSTGLYSPDIITTLMKYYYQILKAVINNDQLLIEEVEIEATAESY